jgi:hypothetical protein
MMQKQDSFSYGSAGTCRYRSHTMNALDAVLTPGTPSNRIVTAAVALAAWRYRRRLMLLSMAYTMLMWERDDEEDGTTFG